MEFDRTIATFIGVPVLFLSAYVGWTYKKKEERQKELKERISKVEEQIYSLRDKGVLYWNVSEGSLDDQKRSREIKSMEVQVARSISTLYSFYGIEDRHIDHHRRRLRQALTDGTFEQSDRVLGDVARAERVIDCAACLVEHVRRNFLIY